MKKMPVWSMNYVIPVWSQWNYLFLCVHEICIVATQLQREWYPKVWLWCQYQSPNPTPCWFVSTQWTLSWLHHPRIQPTRECWKRWTFSWLLEDLFHQTGPHHVMAGKLSLLHFQKPTGIGQCTEELLDHHWVFCSLRFYHKDCKGVA